MQWNPDQGTGLAGTAWWPRGRCLSTRFSSWLHGARSGTGSLREDITGAARLPGGAVRRGRFEPAGVPVAEGEVAAEGVLRAQPGIRVDGARAGVAAIPPAHYLRSQAVKSLVGRECDLAG